VSSESLEEEARNPMPDSAGATHTTSADAWKLLFLLPALSIVGMVILAEVLDRVYDGGGPLAAFINAVLAMVLLTAMVVLYMPMRPVGTRLSWGEAMVAAVFVFLFMAVGYGVLPDQWIDLCAYWGWDDPTRTIAGDDAVWGWVAELFTWFPFNKWKVNYIHIRDIVVVLIHVVAIGLNVVLWGMWQKRGEPKAAIEPTSDFGRPLLREAGR
jgi:hypothetical protein